MKKKPIAYVSNKLVEAKSKKEWSITERKFILAIVSKINVIDLNADQTFTFKISKSEFQELTRCPSSQVPRYIRGITESMLEQYTFIEDGLKLKGFSWLTECEFDGETLSIEVNKNLVPYLLDLKRYTSIELDNILYMSSAHAIQIYVLCKSYLNYCSKYGRPFSKNIDELKEMLGIQGKYSQVSMFKSKVLEISRREINAKTDLDIEYVMKKEGRSFRAIDFNVKSKNKQIETNSDETEIFNKLVKYGFNEKSARNLLAKFSPKEINYGIAKHENRVSQGKPVETPQGYITFMTRNYDPSQVLQPSVSEIDDKEIINYQKILSKKWSLLENFCADKSGLIQILFQYLDENNYENLKEMEDFIISLCDFLEEELSELLYDESYSKRIITTLIINNTGGYKMNYLVDLAQQCYMHVYQDNASSNQ